MGKISTDIIEKAVYELAKRANIKMPFWAYDRICKELSSSRDENSSTFFNYFKENTFLANKNQRPLCQDTGQVLVFLKINQNLSFEGKFIEDAINEAIKNCYVKNFFRKSTVEDAIFDRKNRQDNTPAVIYTEYSKDEGIEINLLIKGGGAENKTELFMLTPTSSELDIIAKIAEAVSKAGTSACPPSFLGVGMGGTADKAVLLSKKAFFDGNKTDKQKFLAEKMKDYVNAFVVTSGFEKTVVDIRILSAPTHIACLPVALSFNCHSLRHSSCKITDSGKILYSDNDYDPDTVALEKCNLKKYNAQDIDSIRKIKSGEKFLLSGEIFTARDAAHNEISKIIAKGGKLPFELKDKIIFYAGPCPKNENEIIGPVGPTTSGRMDKFSKLVAEQGILATIGKGERSEETQKIFNENDIKYFTMYGGISNYIASCVKSCQTVAFSELGAEAVYKLTVEDLPLNCV